MNDEERERMERQLSEALEEGEMHNEDADRAARRKMIYPVEVRVAAERDPVVEETKRYRAIAEEVDGRYDRRAERGRPGEPE